MCVLGWVPQREILHHPTTSGFWAHYAWNFALENICARISFLEWPCFDCKARPQLQVIESFNACVHGVVRVLTKMPLFYM
jgi:hypothetical protein